MSSNDFRDQEESSQSIEVSIEDKMDTVEVLHFLIKKHGLDPAFNGLSGDQVDMLMVIIRDFVSSGKAHIDRMRN